MANAGGTVSPFIRFGRSYRHPNLEELLFAGAATAGSIAPNITVKPETGNNFDIGAKFAVGRVSGGAYAFVNQYQNFIAQDLVVAVTPAGPLAQATNFGDVRIRGVELALDAPIVSRYGSADAQRRGGVHARHHHRRRGSAAASASTARRPTTSRR